MYDIIKFCFAISADALLIVSIPSFLQRNKPKPIALNIIQQ